MRNSYELILVFTPSLSDSNLDKSFREIVDFLKSNNSEIIQLEKWGLKKLAYNINKKTSGYYFLVEYVADSNLINELIILLNRNTELLRYLNVKMDKYHKEYSTTRRTRLKEKEPKIFI